MSKMITLSETDLATLIKDEVAKAVAAQTKFGPSPFKIVVTRDIPSESGKPWANIEVQSEPTVSIVDGKRTVRYAKVQSLFIDDERDGGKRKKDNASQYIFYCKPMGDKPAAPAKAKRSAKA